MRDLLCLQITLIYLPFWETFCYRIDTTLSVYFNPLLNIPKIQSITLISQVQDAKNKGANIVCGGNSLESSLSGAYLEPTLLTNITYDMQIWTEEVFGPVLPVVSFKTEEEAIALANDTLYGLGGYIYSQNAEQAQRVSKQIKTGMVNINGTSYLQPSNPFGGYKSSGIGRQHGKYGFGEVTQVKVVARSK